ncbi:MAG: diguanylate cyclase (GGDEF)-like protein [Oleiphilaceae bacterium]|jgi:diguanylate cyclase (GGDEF)-like protein
MIVSSVATISAVLFATNASVERQSSDKLDIGRRVFEQLMQNRSQQLFGSAELLTEDFGFKGAVAQGDQGTILSVLENHGARIGADLMMLASLDGELIARTDASISSTKGFPFVHLLPKAVIDNGLMTVAMVDGTAYQLVLLQVSAPRPIAWAAMGFIIDQSLANQLKSLTNLEVSYLGVDSFNDNFVISTMQKETHDGILNERMQSDYLKSFEAIDKLKRMQLGPNEYLSLYVPIVATPEYKVNAVLSASLSEERNNFYLLKIEILLVAILSLIGSFIGAFFLSGNITRPIKNLVDAAKRISSGDYSVDLPLVNNIKDEVNVLASSFNVMQKGIADREEKILHQAYHDTLTNLPNRMLATQEMRKLISFCHDTDGSFALMAMNINRFKQINDTFGYQTGDGLLKAFSTRLGEINKGVNFCARLGADEFLLLIQSQGDVNFSSLVESSVKSLSKSYFIDDFEVIVSLRVGVAIYPLDGDKTGQLLRRTEIALNDAKQKKREIQFYEQGSDARHQNRIRLINDLKLAISNNDLVMFYQPKVDLHLRKVTQVEALIRWFHKELKFVSPEEFIGLAEQAGLMPVLTRWVLKTVIEELSAWLKSGVDVAMAVNLSAYDLAHDDLPDYIDELLAQYDVPATHLILEVTESAVIEEPEQAMRVLNRFKDSGIKLAIDDYGTGYSSLGQLKNMPVDELKIDKSFVLKLEQDKDDQVIVRSTIEMGHNIGLTIVAEGVETKAAWDLLESYGCDKLQGYFISKPQAPSDFLRWYSSYQVDK